MRKIMVEIDAGEKHCGNCEHIYKNLKDFAICTQFRQGEKKEFVPVVKKGWEYLRCHACLTAEIKDSEYICKCGIRVTPHQCSDKIDF